MKQLWKYSSNLCYGITAFRPNNLKMWGFVSEPKFVCCINMLANISPKELLVWRCADLIHSVLFHRFTFQWCVLVCLRFVALPVGRWYKIREAPPKKVEHNDVLEKAFKQYKRTLPNHAIVVVCAIFYVHHIFEWQILTVTFSCGWIGCLWRAASQHTSHEACNLSSTLLLYDDSCNMSCQ